MYIALAVILVGIINCWWHRYSITSLGFLLFCVVFGSAAELCVSLMHENIYNKHDYESCYVIGDSELTIIQQKMMLDYLGKYQSVSSPILDQFVQWDGDVSSAVSFWDCED